MTGKLSDSEIAELLESASDPENAARRLGHSVASEPLSFEERAVAEQLLWQLVDHASVKVREVIAQTLRDSPHLPHDIARKLIADVESVAVPVLRSSPIVLTDDLLQVILAGSPEKQIAIAGRRTVPPVIAEALIQTTNNRAVATLVGNPGAALDETMLEQVAGRFGGDQTVAEVLGRHPRISTLVAERLTHFGASSLIDYFRAHPELPAPVVAQMVLRMLEEMSVGVHEDRHISEGLKMVVTYLHGRRQLSPPLIRQAICAGEIEFYEQAIAIRAEIPVENTLVLLSDAGPLGLASLIDAAELPSRFVALLQLAQQVMIEKFGETNDWNRRIYQRAMLERLAADPQSDPADADYLRIRLAPVDDAPLDHHATEPPALRNRALDAIRRALQAAAPHPGPAS